MAEGTETPFVNGHVPLQLLMERFKLRKSKDDPDGLVGDCPINHGFECTFDCKPTELGWRITYCESGCLPSEIFAESRPLDQRESGDDTSEETLPKANLFRDSHKRFTAGDLDAEPPPLKFILKPYIPAGTVSVLSGPGGSNKTTIMLYLAVCRALGRHMFKGLVPEEGETLILTTEDRLEDYQRKLAAVRAYMGGDFDTKLVAERIHFMDLSGVPVRLVSAERGEQFVPTMSVELLAEALKERAPGARHVVMETVSRLTGGVETNSSLAILVEATQRVCRLADVAATLVAHVSQDAARNGVADAYASRGGSALGDNARSSMVLTALSDKNREEYASGVTVTDEDMKRTLVWTHPKGNGTPPTKPLLLQRETTRYGPVLVLAQFEAEQTPRKPGRQAERTYDQLKAAIVACVAARTPITGNGVFYEIKGTRGTFLRAVEELVKALVLQRGEDDMLSVRDTPPLNSNHSVPVPQEPPVRTGSLSERERERPVPVPDWFGSSGSENRTVPPTEKPT